MMRRSALYFVTLVLLLTSCGQPNGTPSTGSSSRNAPVGNSLTWQEQYDLGLRYLSEGNYQEAILAFTAAIEIDSKQAAVYVSRGSAYVLSGETEENLTAAQFDFEKAVELDGTNASAYLGLADVYIRQGDYDKALEILRQGLEQTGENQEIADRISEIEKGNISDSSGNIRRMSAYDENGVLIWWHDYTYYENGKRASATSYDAAGNQTGHVDMQYREDGKALNSILSSSSGAVSEIKYEYDDAGKRIKEIFYELDGVSISHVNLNEYGSNGQRIKMEYCKQNDELLYTRFFEYDSQGHIIKESDYDPDGRSRGYFLREYNSDGKQTKYSRYTSRNVLQWQRLTFYDETGKQIRVEQYDGNGQLTQSQSYD